MELALRPKERELLSAAGEAGRREQLMDQVWHETWTGPTKTLNVHLVNVRRKLAQAGDRWNRITTLRGCAYRFEVD